MFADRLEVKWFYLSVWPLRGFNIPRCNVGQRIPPTSCGSSGILEFHCDDCGSDPGFRSRRRTFSERYLLPIFLLQPVRCAECFRRDYRLIFIPVRERLSEAVSSCRLLQSFSPIEIVYPQRCLAGPNAVILAEEQATRKSAFLRGFTEAVFSSSGDRIRAIQATAATAGPSIASADRPSWVSRVSVQVAENIFAVLFPSDCRICGEPLVKISRLPVRQECLDGQQRIRGGVCSICSQRLFSAYALSGSDEAEGAPLADCAGASNRLLCGRWLMAATMADCGS